MGLWRRQSRPAAPGAIRCGGHRDGPLISGCKTMVLGADLARDQNGSAMDPDGTGHSAYRYQPDRVPAGCDYRMVYQQRWRPGAGIYPFRAASVVDIPFGN